MAGHDGADPTSSPRPVDDVVGGLEAPVTGLRAAVPEAHFFHDLHADVETAVRTAIGAVQALGVRVGGVKLPDVWTLTQECNVPIVSAEAATEHAPLLRERRDEVQPVVYARASAGFSVSAGQYLQAQRVRERFAGDFVAAAFPDAERIAQALRHAAHAVAHGRAVDAARALHRAVTRGENDDLALLGGDGLAA